MNGRMALKLSIEEDMIAGHWRRALATCQPWVQPAVIMMNATPI